MGDLEKYAGLKQAIIDGDIEKVSEFAHQVLEAKLNPAEAIDKGLLEGIKVVGDAFNNGETYLPELVMAAEAMKAGSTILQAEIERRGEKVNYIGRLLIGTVKGDIHDIGKSLVSTMFKAAGFEVVDLGTDVPTEKFVEAVASIKPDLLGLSSLLTASAPEQAKVIGALTGAGLRDKVKVIVGGGAITRQWAEMIHADGFAIDAASAVQVGRDLLGTK